MKNVESTGLTRRELLLAAVTGLAGCGHIRAPQSREKVETDAVRAHAKNIMINPNQTKTKEELEQEAAQQLEAPRKELERIIRDGADFMTEQECTQLLGALVTTNVTGKSVYGVTQKFNPLAQQYVFAGASILSEFPTLAPFAFETVKNIRSEKKKEQEEGRPVDESWLGKVRSAMSAAEKNAYDPRLDKPDFVKKLASEYLQRANEELLTAEY